MFEIRNLVVMLLVAAAPAAIAQGVAPDPAAAQKSRVLTQQGRAADESAAAAPKSADATKPRHETANGSIRNVQAREAAPGAPGGSAPAKGTPAAAARETALGGPDTAARDKNKGTPKTSMPLGAGQPTPGADASAPKAGPPASR